MLVTSQLPIQTKKFSIVFDVHLCPLWKRFRHPCFHYTDTNFWAGIQWLDSQ